MVLTSMTGFARHEGVYDGPHDSAVIQAEARCVNGRSSDIKLRLPSGMEALDKPVRALFQPVVRRGNANITISLQRESNRAPRINAQTLQALHKDVAMHAKELGLNAPTLSDLLALPGVIEMVDESSVPAPNAADGPGDDAPDNDAPMPAFHAAVLDCAKACADQLGHARRQEGAAMLVVLADLIEQIDQETQSLAALPEARGEHLFARLKAQIDHLLVDGADLDEQRLHQEVAALATKADIGEELARLKAHCEAARSLFASGDPVGRKLDFLAQELNREANTVCSKASALPITQKGLALKALIDQFKEQVQNIE